jgi:hypothetical protein
MDVRAFDDLNLKGSATIRETQYIINSSYNQRQRFFQLSHEPMDVVITVENVRAPNAGRRSGAPNMY